MNPSKNRKAISPVLATVILIAITLIAAIAIAGFVFGLFGSFTSSAQVSAVSVTCGGAPVVCSVNLQNTGSSNTSPTTCSIQIAGVATAGTAAPLTAIVAGAAPTLHTCTLAAGPVKGATGSTAQGSFTLSNGATVTFTGTWS